MVVPTLLLALGGFTFVVFSWAVAFVDTAVVSSVYQTWPLMWMLAMRRVDRARRGVTSAGPVPWAAYCLMPVALGGVALVVSSTGSSGARVGIEAAGLVLLLVMMVIEVLPVSHFLAVDRIIHGRVGHSPRRTGYAGLKATEAEVEISLRMFVVAQASIMPVVITAAAVESKTLSGVVSWPLLGGFIAGAVFYAPGSYLLRRAYFVCSRREIVAVQYLEPALVLLWLWPLRGIDVARVGHLLAGVALIVAANIAIYLTRPRSGVAEHQLG